MIFGRKASYKYNLWTLRSYEHNYIVSSSGIASSPTAPGIMWGTWISRSLPEVQKSVDCS